jgi:hypothetical protein
MLAHEWSAQLFYWGNLLQSILNDDHSARSKFAGKPRRRLIGARNRRRLKRAVQYLVDTRCALIPNPKKPWNPNWIYR